MPRPKKNIRARWVWTTIGEFTGEHKNATNKNACLPREGLARQLLSAISCVAAGCKDTLLTVACELGVGGRVGVSVRVSVTAERWFRPLREIHRLRNWPPLSFGHRSIACHQARTASAALRADARDVR